MRLEEQQRLLWRLVRGEAQAALAHEHFVPRGALDALARVNIYRNMYWQRQYEALKEGFSQVEAALGTEAFRALVRSYLGHHPSRHPSLEWLGERLPGFMRSSGQESWRALADLAELEWARCHAFLVPEAPTVAATEVRPEVFSLARLSFIPALFLLELAAGTPERWQEPGAAPASTEGSVHVAVWRREYAVSHAVLSPLEATALTRAREGAGATVAEVCELFSSQPEPEQAALSALGLWFARGWVTRLHYPDNLPSERSTCS